jgi:hypothetical protein
MIETGLLSDHSGSFESYIPDGPTFSGGIRMKFDAASKKIYAVSGGFTSSLVPIGKTELLNGFASGDWNAEATLLDKDLTDVEISGNKLFLIITRVWSSNNREWIVNTV